MDQIDQEIAEIIADALASGHDVEIKITPTLDGGAGTLKLPGAWVNRMADRRLSAPKVTDTNP